MADPVSAMAVISMGTTAAGGIVNAFGTAQKADAQTAMYNYKAGVAQANAAIAEQNVVYSQEEGAIKATDVGLKGQQELGHIETAQAASGLDVNTGTAAQVRRSEVAGIQESEGIVTYDAAKKAYGFSIQAADFRNEAQFDVMSGENVQAAKGFDIASSLLGGATSVADKWTKYSQSGIFSSGGSGGGTGAFSSIG